MANEITISTNDSDLRSMLIKLMGRGTTISQSYSGQYEITLVELIDLVSKIAQRVALQNHCKMSDFHGQFEFQDGARESVPSFEQLNAYRTLNSSSCVKVVFSFAFLIDFYGRGIEKQSVTIEFTNRGFDKEFRWYNLFVKDSSLSDSRFGNLNMNVEYTDITWANDIKNLFAQYVKAHVHEYRFREFLATILDFRLVFIIAMPTSFILMAGIMDIGKDSVMALVGDKINEMSNLPTIDRIEQKLEIIVYGENRASGLKALLIPLGSVIALGALCGVILAVVRNIPYSAVILSDEAQKMYDRASKRRAVFNNIALGGVALSIVVSVAASNIDRWIMSFFSG